MLVVDSSCFVLFFIPYRGLACCLLSCFVSFVHSHRLHYVNFCFRSHLAHVGACVFCRSLEVNSAGILEAPYPPDILYSHVLVTHLTNVPAIRNAIMKALGMLAGNIHGGGSHSRAHQHIVPCPPLLPSLATYLLTWGFAHACCCCRRLLFRVGVPFFFLFFFFRTGRVRPGTVYKLYSRVMGEQIMSEHADSEIKRLSLDSLVLDLKSMMPDSPVVPVLQVRDDPIGAARCGTVLVGRDDGSHRMTERQFAC